MLRIVQLLRSLLLILITVVAQGIQPAMGTYFPGCLECRGTVPTAAWTLQQFREAIPSDHTCRFLVHDRDSSFSAEVDDDLRAFGLKILRTPVQAPKANAYRERLIGSMRRECLDWVIPLNEKHLRRILREWVVHYNRGRPRCQSWSGNSRTGYYATAKPEASQTRVAAGLSDKN
jgi:Integrase core domain